VRRKKKKKEKGCPHTGVAKIEPHLLCRQGGANLRERKGKRVQKENHELTYGAMRKKEKKKKEKERDGRVGVGYAHPANVRERKKEEKKKGREGAPAARAPFFSFSTVSDVI